MQRVLVDINMKSNLNSAFTLIEMLVVISLIGILATLALVSFGASQKQARDTARRSDLKQYQTAVENYANLNNGIYPVYATATTIPSSGGLCTALNIGTCPLDVKNVSPYLYKYISDTNGTNYIFWAGLEAKTPTQYFIICSNGKSGQSTTAPSSSTCPI